MVDAQGDEVFGGVGDDEGGLVPVDIEGGRVGIAGDGFGDIVVGHGVEAGVVGFALHQPRFSGRDAR